MSNEDFIACIKDFCSHIGATGVPTEEYTEEFISAFVLARTESNRPYVEECMYIRGAGKKKCGKITESGTVFCKQCLSKKASLKQIPSMLKTALSKSPKDDKLIEVLNKSRRILNPNAPIKTAPKKPVDDGVMMDRVEGSVLMWYRDLNIVYQKLTPRGYIALGGFENNVMPTRDDINQGTIRFTQLTDEQIEFCHLKNFGVLTDAPEINGVDATNGVNLLDTLATKSISSFFKTTKPETVSASSEKKEITQPPQKKQKSIAPFLTQAQSGGPSNPPATKLRTLAIDSDDE